MSYIKIKSHAKINLALNVVSKSKSLHKIESLISFLTLYDEIKIKKINSKKHKISFIGKFSKGIYSKNTISQLIKEIENKKILKNKYQIIVRKNIPHKSGLGGGSMNAASILNFFIKNKFIILKKKKIEEIANSIGSDVILGLYSKKKIVLNQNNQIKVVSNKKKFHILIVMPNFGCSTKKIYLKVKKFSKPEFNLNSKNLFNLNFLKKSKNDLELIAFNEYPKLRILKNYLIDLSGSEFVRMTGSGSAIIAYFNSAKMCHDAEKKVKNKFKKYWCITSKTI